MVVLAYLWPLAIVPLLASRGDGDVSWHARQGLLLMAAELPVLIVLTGLTALAGLANYGLGVTLGLVVFLVWVAVLGRAARGHAVRIEREAACGARELPSSRTSSRENDQGA